MRRLLTVVLLAVACYPPVVYVDPYDTCGSSNDVCNGGLFCADTTLPASTGFTGAFCTAGCEFDEDCPQLVSNFESICVNSQCYLTCPSSASCPYGQGCLTFTDQFGVLLNLCSP